MPGDLLTAAQDHHLVNKALHQNILEAERCRRAVERCNAAWRYEFYQTYDLPSSVEALNPILDSFQHLYNHHRPHGALAGQTPAAYLAKRQAAEIKPSHMS